MRRSIAGIVELRGTGCERSPTHRWRPEDGVLVIRRIHVAIHLVAPEAARETVERTHSLYAMRCPLYRTLHKTIQLTSSFELTAPAVTS
jgi:uncharacterized OsmC-like protein